MARSDVLMWVDGVETPSATISVLDWGLQRGDGCFEVLRSYDGKAFGTEEHIARLEWSASCLGMALPSSALLVAWTTQAAARGGDCTVRILVTRGSPTYGERSVVVVLAEPVPPVPDQLRLMTVTAPWHAAGRPWDLAGVKSLSYGPNVAATRHAQQRGSHDAILVSDERTVLEGPTFTVAWVLDGVLETPSLDLLILDSISRRYVLRSAATAGVEVREGHFDVDRMLAADEVVATSTIKEVTSVVEVDGTRFESGQVAATLRAGFRELVYG